MTIPPPTELFFFPPAPLVHPPPLSSSNSLPPVRPVSPRRPRPRPLRARAAAAVAMGGLAGAGAGAVEAQARACERYLRDVAGVGRPPGELAGLYYVLGEVDGAEVVSPGARKGLHPFVVPLGRVGADGARTIGLLRWPTAPAGMDMPVVRTGAGGAWVELLGNSAAQYLGRRAAEAEAGGEGGLGRTLQAAAGRRQRRGAGGAGAGRRGLAGAVLLEVGPFVDIYEGLAERHLGRGDAASALVACEKSARSFPGWGRPHVFHARVLARLGRAAEARDAARAALQLPLWTLGADPGRVAALAGFRDRRSLARIYRRLAADPRPQEVAQGKPPQQVALDRAAYLMDCAVADGRTEWDDIKAPLADLYTQAQMPHLAAFVQY